MRPRTISSAVPILALVLWAAPSSAQGPESNRAYCGAAAPGEQAPVEKFCPPVADPKQPRSFVAFLRGEFTTPPVTGLDATNIAAVGLADSFVMLHRSSSAEGNGIDLGFAGAVFAQFELGAGSVGLINADYVISLPLTWRSSALSGRLRLYHQSSHVGADFANHLNVLDINLTYEALEALLSLDAGRFRVYGGGELLLRREPPALGRVLVAGGAEVTGYADRAVSLLAGADVRLSDSRDRGLDLSVRAGVQIDLTNRGRIPGGRILVLAEFYEGHSPFGTIFVGPVRYAGLGVHLLH